MLLMERMEKPPRRHCIWRPARASVRLWLVCSRPVLRRLPPEQTAVIPGSDNSTEDSSSLLRCVNCRARLLAVEQLCFYAKSEKEVHLIIKPELFHVDTFPEPFPRLVLGDAGDKRRTAQVRCANCGSVVGTLVAKSFVGFGSHSVTLLDHAFPRKAMWSLVRQMPIMASSICSRSYLRR